jgi:hypothetical protein
LIVLFVENRINEEFNFESDFSKLYYAFYPNCLIAANLIDIDITQLHNLFKTTFEE